MSLFYYTAKYYQKGFMLTSLTALACSGVILTVAIAGYAPTFLYGAYLVSSGNWVGLRDFCARGHLGATFIKN